MASLDSQGEIVPIEPPNPELTQMRWRGDENKLVCSRQHLILQLLLDIAAFMRHASIGCYGNNLTGVEQKPKILKHSWLHRSRVMWNSCRHYHYKHHNDSLIQNRLSSVVVGRWSIIIESWSKSSSDATIDYAFFIIDCRGKIKNLLVTNKSIKINKNVRLISWCELSFSWTFNF